MMMIIMDFIFEPEWESSKEDDDAYYIYEEIVIPKIKEIKGLWPRWDRYEKMPITGLMKANKDEMDFHRTLTQNPLERLKELWQYMSKDIGENLLISWEIPKTVKLRIVQVIEEAERRKTQVHYGWGRDLEDFGEYEVSDIQEALTTLRTDELKNAHIFTPPSPPPKNDLKAQVDYLWNNTQSFGGETKVPKHPKNGKSGDRASWLSLADNRITEGWERNEIRSYSSMSFNRDFQWKTDNDGETSLIYQTFKDRATLHLRPKNTSNHITKFITVSSQDEVQIRRYFTPIPNRNRDEYYRSTITQFIKSISYAANYEMREGNKSEPFAVDADVIKKFLNQDETMWIYDNWEELFTKEWEQAAREAYESMNPAILGLSIEPTHDTKGNFSGLILTVVFNYHPWFDMKKARGKYGTIDVDKADALSGLNFPVEFSLFHGYTTYAEQKHPKLKYYERGLGLFNWWW